MEKELQAIKVRTNDEWVVIEQDNYPEEPASILVSPEQIPILVKWLQEAAKEFAPRQS